MTLTFNMAPSNRAPRPPNPLNFQNEEEHLRHFMEVLLQVLAVLNRNEGRPAGRANDLGGMQSGNLFGGVSKMS